MDRHKKRYNVVFALNQKEFQRLDAILSKIGQPAHRVLGHFFESLTQLPFDEKMLKPPVHPEKITETRKTFCVRLSGKAYFRIKRSAKERSMTLGHVARTLCTRSIELCEFTGVHVMPKKEEITGWFKEQTMSPPPQIPVWLRDFVRKARG